MPAPLGHRQNSALQKLASHNSGSWTPACGWLIGTASETRRIPDSLAARGLAVRTSVRPPRYTITVKGLAELGWYTCADCSRLTRRPYFARTDGQRIVRCEQCHELSTFGLCERCDGDCSDGLPVPRIGAWHLMLSRTCLAVMYCESAEAAGARLCGNAAPLR
ncbi:hypothetical protein ACFYZ8_33735 [Streptomyces sp. NPDC001668]|uniref:hypothetical protein n=1 Tax=Streptomyces sp. NPDC001668 TaxID=3364598 RepID=UPI0036A96518